ncbi:hypothetical protein AGOR_G00062100 [Albula goreensis]|uniref:C-X-C chemokine receptor type 2 n=1 Tax=Albula goreensis TaxID=1534307 RepID=A0A8T3DVN5_9TELE|nr:hypothetical protein AGOR_G00062100 [Albula goreensis]
MEGFSTPSIYEDYENSTFDVEDIGAVATPCVHWTLGSLSIVLVSIYSIVFLFSLLGNTLVISVVYCMKEGRTSTDIYLMNLALADLLFSVTLPFWAVYVHSQWIFGNFMCKLLSGLQEMTFYSGTLLLACISIDRYLAIVRATQIISKKQNLVAMTCGAVWLGAALLSLPILVQRQAFQPRNAQRMVCHENLSAESMTEWRVGIRVLQHSVGFFIPLSIMIFCYGFTTSTLLSARGGQRYKAMRVILAVVLAFVVCWLPHNVTVMVDTLMRVELVQETCDFRKRVDLALLVTQVLAFLHCTINPILYAFIGQKFRNELLASLYKHGLISKKAHITWRKGTVHNSVFCKSSITL